MEAWKDIYDFHSDDGSCSRNIADNHDLMPHATTLWSEKATRIVMKHLDSLWNPEHRDDWCHQKHNDAIERALAELNEHGQVKYNKERLRTKTYAVRDWLKREARQSGSKASGNNLSADSTEPMAARTTSACLPDENENESVVGNLGGAGPDIYNFPNDHEISSAIASPSLRRPAVWTERATQIVCRHLKLLWNPKHSHKYWHSPKHDEDVRKVLAELNDSSEIKYDSERLRRKTYSLRESNKWKSGEDSEDEPEVDSPALQKRAWPEKHSQIVLNSLDVLYNPARKEEWSNQKHKDLIQEILAQLNDGSGPAYDKRRLWRKAWTLRRAQRRKSSPGGKKQHGDFAKLTAAEKSANHPSPTPRSVDTNGHKGYRSHHGGPKKTLRERLHRATKRKMYDSNNREENGEEEESHEYPSRSTKPNRTSSTTGNQQEDDEPHRNRRQKMDRFLGADNESTNGTESDSSENLELMSIREERDKLQAECERLKGELEESEFRHKAAKVTLMSVEERRDELITIAMQLTGDKNGLQGQAKDLAKERDCALEENENLIAENERLRARLTEVSRLNGMIGDLAIENISSGKQ